MKKIRLLLGIVLLMGVMSSPVVNLGGGPAPTCDPVSPDCSLPN